MLDLVRLSPRRIFPPGGVDLCRQISSLTDLAPNQELLDVACGRGVTLEYFVREQGAIGTGVDADPVVVDQAESYARETGMADRMSFQAASSDDLPFRDGSFDVGIGELGLSAGVDPEQALRELVRVVRPGGRVVLVQLVWKAPVEEGRKSVLAAHLGAQPLMLVELRRMLLGAGVGSIHTEDWTDEETAFRAQVKNPFPDFAELFSLPEKLGILRRARRRWGWRGVRTVFQREAEVHRLLTRERILGLNLLNGVKEQGDQAPTSEESVSEGRVSPDGRIDAEAESSEEGPATQDSEEDDGGETEGLPLFQSARSPIRF
jgi:ubiquinone/menaquinone biosynthesis C-methylase UbiE